MPVTFKIESNFGAALEVFEGAIGDLQRFDLKAKPAKGGPPRSLWDRMHTSWIASRKAMFDSVGAAAGTPWLTYSQTGEAEFYAAWKARRIGRETTPLDVLRWPSTDRIYATMTDPANPLHIFRPRPLTVEFGTALPYAAKHNLGLGVAPEYLGGHGIPQRPLMAIGSGLRQSWERDMIDYAIDVGAPIGRKLTAAQAALLPLATT